MKRGSVVSLIGCGGKTSIMQQLCFENKNSKVLMTTSTRIFVPPDPYIDLHISNIHTDNLGRKQGVQCVGLYNEQQKKIESLPLKTLNKIVDLYDYSFIEADGSNGLPLKGWNDHEPVIIEKTTHTLGVITVKSVGLKVNNDSVFRLQRFINTTGAHRDSYVTVSMLGLMVHEMFKKARGRKVLIIHQVENDDEYKTAQKIVDQITDSNNTVVDDYLAGSCKLNTWQKLII